MNQQHQACKEFSLRDWRKCSQRDGKKKYLVSSLRQWYRYGQKRENGSSVFLSSVAVMQTQETTTQKQMQPPRTIACNNRAGSSRSSRKARELREREREEREMRLCLLLTPTTSFHIHGPCVSLSWIWRMRTHETGHGRERWRFRQFINDGCDLPRDPRRSRLILSFVIWIRQPALAFCCLLPSGQRMVQIL